MTSTGAADRGPRDGPAPGARPGRPGRAVRPWSLLVVAWSVVFAAPHVYWAAGGRGGLGDSSAAADAALATPWFAAYNLVVTVLALAAALVASGLARGRFGPGARRWFALVAAAGAVALLARGALGVGLLLAGVPTGTASPGTAPVLVAIEPWFLVGALAFGGLARSLRLA
ncbi:MAG: DUF3995 domain-containing protein [Pseudonocardia sp.]